jgi:hypothetical protein
LPIVLGAAREESGHFSRRQIPDPHSAGGVFPSAQLSCTHDDPCERARTLIEVEDRLDKPLLTEAAIAAAALAELRHGSHDIGVNALKRLIGHGQAYLPSGTHSSNDQFQ